jgi:ABC-2 type transport system ATP-binding protein
VTAGIVVEGLTKTYRRGKVRALNGVSLEIRSGEAFGIIGPNGAGKTTLMGCVLGSLRPDGGRIAVEGLEPDDLAVRAATGYLPERLSFDRWMTGRDFLAHHHALARRPAGSRAAEVEATLESVGLDRAAWTQALRLYSRGMLQRLGFAQAIIGRPRFLYLDEPTSGMDPVGVVMIRRIVDQLRHDGVTIVLNSHQLEQVERFCDRVAYVRAGEVESVEVLAAGSTAKRVVRNHAAGDPPPAGRLAALAREAGCEYLGETTRWARFSVPSDEAAVALVRVLVQAGIPVMEAGPEEGRLERLFFRAPGAES